MSDFILSPEELDLVPDPAPNDLDEAFTTDESSWLGNLSKNAYVDNMQKLMELERMFSKSKQNEAFKNSTVDIGFKLTTVIAVFGCFAVLLNMFLIVIILAHGRNLLRHVFYILLLNFAIVDTIRGASLLLSAVFLLKPDSGGNMDAKMTTMITEQSVLLVLRFTNLVIIFNLLIITLNEYIFVCHPFHYHNLVNRCRVLIVVFCTWLLSAAFVILSTFARNQQTRIMVKVPPHGGNATTVTAAADLKRHNGGKAVDLESIFHFTMLAFCFVCLVVIIVCYTSFFLVIRRIQREDDLLRKQSTACMARPSLTPSEQQVGLLAATGAAPDERRSRQTLLRRHKYAFVIGLVIAVYMLYLVSYSTIQILHFDTIKQDGHFKHAMLITRWSAKVLIGLHAVLQPLCYLRVREFRALIFKTCCYKIYQRKQREQLLSLRRESYVNGTSIGPERRESGPESVKLDTFGTLSTSTNVAAPSMVVLKNGRQTTPLINNNNNNNHRQSVTFVDNMPTHYQKTAAYDGNFAF